MMSEYPGARTNVSVGGFGPLLGDTWCAFLVHPAGYVLAAFYEPATRQSCGETDFAWPLEGRWREALRGSARSLLNTASIPSASLVFGNSLSMERETVTATCRTCLLCLGTTHNPNDVADGFCPCCGSDPHPKACSHRTGPYYTLSEGRQN